MNKMLAKFTAKIVAKLKTFKIFFYCHLKVNSVIYGLRLL